MADGALWRGTCQAGVETTYGTAVAATRRMYYEAPVFHLVRQPRPHMFATGTRDNVRSVSIGPQEVSGDLKQPLSSAEIVELLLMHLDGAVTPSSLGSGAYLWDFKPSSAAVPLKSATFEWDDGANPWHVAGLYCEQLQIKGSANAANEVTATLFGKSIAAGALTGALSSRTPDVTEGWETSLYIDAFGGTPGSTVVNGFLINWDVTLKANLARKYFAQNSNTLGAVIPGVIGVQAVLTFEASAAQALTEFADFNVAVATPTYRLVRLDFGENSVIGGGITRSTKIDLPGAWAALSLGETDAGTRVYKLTLDYVYDSSNAFGVQIQCTNDRATAW